MTLAQAARDLARRAAEAGQRGLPVDASALPALPDWYGTLPLGTLTLAWEDGRRAILFDERGLARYSTEGWLAIALDPSGFLPYRIPVDVPDPPVYRDDAVICQNLSTWFATAHPGDIPRPKPAPARPQRPDPLLLRLGARLAPVFRGKRSPGAEALRDLPEDLVAVRLRQEDWLPDEEFQLWMDGSCVFRHTDLHALRPAILDRACQLRVPAPPGLCVTLSPSAPDFDPEPVRDRVAQRLGLAVPPVDVLESRQLAASQYLVGWQELWKAGGHGDPAAALEDVLVHHAHELRPDLPDLHRALLAEGVSIAEVPPGTLEEVRLQLASGWVVGEVRQADLSSRKTLYASLRGTVVTPPAERLRTARLARQWDVRVTVLSTAELQRVTRSLPSRLEA